MKSTMISALRRFAQIGLAILVLWPVVARADDTPADEGVLTYVIGSKPGGGYDRYGRLVANHLETQLDGSRVIPETRATAGGVPALRSLRDAGPDARLIMTFNTGILLSELAGREGMKVSLDTFNWIGKASSEARVLLVHPNTGVGSFEDLRNAEDGLMFLAAAYGSASHVQTSLINNAFDLGLRVLPGFGGNEAEAALIKGEADGLLISESNVAPLIDAGAAIPVLVFGDAVSDSLRDVPRAESVVMTDDEQRVAKIITTMTVLGRITVAPPDMDPSRVTRLRAAYRAMMNDPGFLADAAAQGLPISYLPGEEAGRLARDILSGDPRIRELVADVFED